MPLIRKIRSVWVPFYVNDTDERIVNVAADLPRFLHPDECKDFLQLNRDTLNRKVQYQERFEPAFKDEYARGVGRLLHWKYGPSYDPESVVVNRRSIRDYDS